MLHSSFDILIECNKSPFTMSSLTSTIREFKKFPEVSGPDNSHELSMGQTIQIPDKGGKPGAEYALIKLL